MALGMVVGAEAQINGADCATPFYLSTIGQRLPIDNRTSGCTIWTVTVSASGYASYQLEVDNASNVAGTAGAYGVWSPALVIDGTFPLTTLAGDKATMTGYYPWVSVQLVTNSGSGFVQGMLYGWKTPPNGVGAISVTNSGGAGALNIQDGGNVIDVQATTWPLPTGASTSAKQAALGIAGTASTDVLSVQGIASMTPLYVSLRDVAGAAFSLGTKTMANSISVTIASDQTPVLGQTTASGSAPVVLASDQSIIPVATLATATTTNAGLGCYQITTAATNALNCKASAGNLYELIALNPTATVIYLRLYNSSGTPTCSSATGFLQSFPVPANTAGTGYTIPIPVGLGMATGIGWCATGGGSSTDNTNGVAGVYLTAIYK